ncbi:uncharacterized protein LOC123891843 [Trifolium pratense]|uniref:uncharacterized protein LOC123891843 n=1 Tax=Trifolium pratense TaxID=57577 RepID=UPI001E6906DD|nr:uncharacterized protein LOC123891843 [Trifolium pratense]
MPTTLAWLKSCYFSLLETRQAEYVEENVLEVIKRLWKTDVPSKINVFGWRLLLNKLPTRTALNRRGILTNSHDLPCVCCFKQLEDSAHLFFSCSFSKEVWSNVLNWLGKTLPLGAEGWYHFILFGDQFNVKDKGRVRYLVWLATTWNIWKLRNLVIFKGVIPDALSVVDAIKLFSWVWFTNPYGRKACYPFSSWCLDSLSCIQNS